MAKEPSPADIRRLNAALGMRTPGGDGLILLLGVCAIAAVWALSLLIQPSGQPERIGGTIENLHGASTRGYIKCPCAFVSIAEGVAVVRLPRHGNCQIGDHIALERRKAPFGYRYSALPSSCSGLR